MLYIEGCDINIYNDEYLLSVPEYALQLVVNIANWPFLNSENYLFLNYILIGGEGEEEEITNATMPVITQPATTNGMESPMTTVTGGEEDVIDTGEADDNTGGDDIMTISQVGGDDDELPNNNNTNSILTNEMGLSYYFNNIFLLDLLNSALVDEQSVVDLLNLTLNDSNGVVEITSIFPQFTDMLEYTSFISIPNVQSNVISTPSVSSTTSTPIAETPSTPPETTSMSTKVETTTTINATRTGPIDETEPTEEEEGKAFNTYGNNLLLTSICTIIISLLLSFYQ